MMLSKQKYPILLFFLLLCQFTDLFGQCPAPVITVDPQPICNLPVTLKAGGGPYISYKWSTTATTPQIVVGANGTYTVTVTCADNTTSEASYTLNFTPPTARMVNSLIRPCLPGQEVHLQIQTNNGIAGTATFTIVSNQGDTIIFENPIGNGTSTVNVNVFPTGPTIYSLVKVVTSGGCMFGLVAPKSTSVIPVFDTAEQFPTIGGDPFFCHGGSTQLNVIWTDPEPTGFLWVTPGFPQWPFPFYNASVQGLYTVNVTYSPNCSIPLQQFVEDVQVIPNIVGSPVCSGGESTLTTTETYVSYEWSTGDTSPEIQITDPGEYRVTVTNAQGCTGFTSKFITQVPAPNLSINGPIALCTGQNSAQLVAFASNIAHYEWSTGATTANILITGPGEFTVTVTSNNGCTAESTQVVEQINTPTVALTSPVYICQGASATLTPNTSTPDVAYLWSNGATTSTIAVSAGGVYRVSVSDPSLSCTSSAFTLVTVLPLPTPTISVSSPTVCEGGTIVLSTNYGLGNTFLWSNGATTSSIGTGTGGTYTVTVTTANGCKGTDSESITVLPVPHPQILGPKSLCGKDSVFLSITPFPSINWSTGDTSTGIWVKTAGNYNVVVTNSSGCTGTTNFNIANTTPGILAVNGSTTLCGSDSIILVANGPFSNFAWSTGVNNDSISINSPGVYNVVATDNLGCTATRSSTVTNQGGFTASVAFAPLCNSTVNLNADNGFASYYWSSGATTQVYQANAAGSYTVTVTNTGGCTASATYNVTVLPEAPVPAVAGPQGVCPSGTGNLSVAGSYQAYIWSTGSTTATAVADAPGSFTVTVTDQYGCTGSNVVTVGAFPAPTPEIAGSQTICNGQPSDLSVSNSYITFEWNTGGTGSSININAAGTYTVTVTNTNGCTSATSIAVTASDILSPNVAVEPYNCDGQLTINAGAGYNTYLWSNGATTSTIAINSPGEYAITVSNDAGCIGTATQIVESIPVTPGLTIQGATTFCSNATTTLTATANFNTYEWNTGSFNPEIQASAAGTYTVTATDAYGCTKVAELTVNTNQAPSPVVVEDGFDCNGNLTLNAGGPYDTYTWSNGSAGSTLVIDQIGLYTVTVVDANACTGENTIAVTQIPSRPAVAVTGPNRICTGSTGTLLADEGFVSYLWSNNATTNSIDVSAAGLYTVTVTDVNNCTATAEQNLDLLDLPVVVISEEPYNCDGVITLSSPEVALYNYAWSNGSTTNTAVVSTSDSYSLTITDADGCSSSAAIPVTVPQAPNPQIVQTPLPNYIMQLDATAGFQSYNWSTGDQTASAVVTTSSIYTVTVTDALGCTATATTEVSLLIDPLTISSTVKEITCNNGNDGNVVLCINGGQPPYSVSSTPVASFQTSSSGTCDEIVTFTGIQGGNFSWTATDANNVSFSGNYTFVSPDPIVASATVTTNTVTASASGGVPPYQYSIDGANFQNSPVFSNLANGAYQVVIQDARGCTFLTNSVIVFVSGTNNPAGDWKLQITPNPGDGNFWLTLENYPADDLQLTVWDVAGRLVKQFNVQTGGTSLFRYPLLLNEAGAGTYMVRVQSENTIKTIPVVLIR